MAAAVFAGIDAAASVELNETLTRGGIAVARVTIAAPGTYWIAPLDSKRTYISFSLSDPTQIITVSPGDDNQPYGYTLHPNQTIIEFGGALLAPLVQGIWRVSGDALDTVDVIVQRSP